MFMRWCCKLRRPAKALPSVGNHIVRDLVDRELLAARQDWAWQTGQGIYLVWSNSRPMSDTAQNFRDWILSYV